MNSSDSDGLSNSASDAIAVVTELLILSKRNYKYLSEKFKDLQNEVNESLKTSQDLEVQLDAANEKLEEVRREMMSEEIKSTEMHRKLKVFSDQFQQEFGQQSSRATGMEIEIPFDRLANTSKNSSKEYSFIVEIPRIEARPSLIERYMTTFPPETTGEKEASQIAKQKKVPPKEVAPRSLNGRSTRTVSTLAVPNTK